MKTNRAILLILTVFFTGLLTTGCSDGTNKNQISKADSKINGISEKIAYIQDGNLWIKELSNDPVRQITTDGGASGPSWSKTGKWVLFHKNNQLWVTDPDGSNCSMVAENVNDTYTWSSIDDVFYYGTDEQGLVSVKPETNETKVLMEPSKVKDFGRLLNSPDARYLAFESLQSGAQESGGIWKLNIANNEVIPLLKAIGPSSETMGMLPHLAGWSADGRAIYVWVGSQSASLTADGVAFTAVDAETGHDLLKNNRNSGSLVHKNWFVAGPDPNLAALIVGTGRETWVNKQLAVINLQTKDTDAVSAQGQVVSSFAFSPSGNRLVYSAGPEEQDMYNGDGNYEAKSRAVMLKRHIWGVNVDGSSLKQLTNDSRYRDEYPVWDAKGDKVLFVRVDKDDKASLWQMEADGSNPKQVIDELSPADWFGFYGYVEWDQWFDYWRG